MLPQKNYLFKRNIVFAILLKAAYDIIIVDFNLMYKQIKKMYIGILLLHNFLCVKCRVYFLT